MVEARLWKGLKDGKVQCRLCNHFCAIRPGELGRCGVRKNVDGTLHALNYGKIAALNLDPVEKKPLYHFQPGSRTFSFATMGCNLGCRFCQNASLSQPPRTGRPPAGTDMTAEELVAGALEHGAASISYTYSEPTIFFEIMQDTARLAVEHGLKNIMVSNGFMSSECLEELAPVMHAANIDLKGFTEDFYKKQCDARLAPVLDNLRHIRSLGWWLEVTTLLIPGLNDSRSELESMARFLAEELGPEVPWHLSRFHPDYKMQDRPPTSVDSLEMAHAIGREAGLHYVYIGNVPGNDYAKTLCPGCGTVLMDRLGFSVGASLIRDGKCTRCGRVIDGVDLG
ncbi:AmmeMemoRadiSam system radical SAM enzyme [Salidesulfovibrio onnuriiensis]|uniref:AmmeMemoRadiSam system radical SAM enzyme n=1 Tax=Salidesulfovibrio onnuriiensis TaxID=2583823 RepID=UPI0011C7DE78|nr:AmmeMemoRadiSam system radical SAM enzyme [Salidesulfovibrio onnuriiensis]